MIQKLFSNAETLEKGATYSARYDLFFDKLSIIIESGELQLVSTGIAFKYPKGTYGRIDPRSGLTIKNQLNVLAGVIDPDYTGEIFVVIFNFGKLSRTIVQGQCIAQVIFENILNPTVQIVKQLPITSRSANEFGSTDKQLTLPISDSTSSELISSPPNKHDKDKETIIPTIKGLKSDLNVSIEMTYDISLSLNPFDNYTHRTLQVKGNHLLPGLS